MYGAPYGGARLDVNGDGIPDVRVGPYGQVRPDVGTFVHGPQMYILLVCGSNNIF